MPRIETDASASSQRHTPADQGKQRADRMHSRMGNGATAHAVEALDHTEAPGYAREAAGELLRDAESPSPERPTPARTGQRASCRCGAQWTGHGVAHCGLCHRTFASAGLFDRHRDQTGEHGRCLDPANSSAIEYRDGMWRGPELTAEQKANLYGGNAA